MKPANPIILALDYDNLEDAERMLSLVRPHIGMIKVGLELFSSVGKEALLLGRYYNIPVFLDLKLCDTPTTVKKTINNLMGTLTSLPGEQFISIHCFGGRDMCKAAIETTQGSNVKPVGITLLTSSDSSDLGNLGFTNRSVGVRTVKTAKVGIGCIDQGTLGHPGHPATHWGPGTPPTPARPPIGLDAFVCAPAQLPLMRKHYKDTITLISPGIRMDGTDAHDHKSAKPASFALRSGANWIVVGRPITQAADPLLVVQHLEKVADKY